MSKAFERLVAAAKQNKEIAENLHTLLEEGEFTLRARPCGKLTDLLNKWVRVQESTLDSVREFRKLR